MNTTIHSLRRKPSRLPNGWATPGLLTVMIAFCAVCFGLVPFFARGLMAEGVPPAGVALYRYIVSAAVMLPFLPSFRVHGRELALGLFAGVCLSLGWLGYVEALRQATVAVVGVIYLSYPLFTVIFAAILLRQRLKPRAFLVGGLILLAATLVAPWGDGAAIGGLSGLGMALMAPVGFSLAMVIAFGLVRKIGNLQRAACVMVGALLGMVPVIAGMEPASLIPPTPKAWSLIGLMAVATTVLPQLIYSFAAPRIGPVRAAVAGSFELPTMFLIGWLALGESIGWAEVIAGAIVVTAIIFAPPPEPVRK